MESSSSHRSRRAPVTWAQVCSGAEKTGCSGKHLPFRQEDKPWEMRPIPELRGRGRGIPEVDQQVSLLHLASPLQPKYPGCSLDHTHAHTHTTDMYTHTLTHSRHRVCFLSTFSLILASLLFWTLYSRQLPRKKKERQAALF